MKWTDFLNEDVYNRLCNCNTVKADLPVLVNAKWRMFKENGKADKEWTKEDVLIAVLELLDANSIEWVWDLTKDEYNELKEG